MVHRIRKLLVRSGIKRLSGDDYIKRLPGLVAGEGMLYPGNDYLFDYAIKNLGTGAVIEIGSYGGLSASLIIHLMKKHGKTNTFFTCDPWIYEGFNDGIEKENNYIDGRNDITRSGYSEYMKNSFMEAMLFLNAKNLPFTLNVASDNFFEIWNDRKTVVDIFNREVRTGGPVSFCYIDGDHSYESAKRDFLNVMNYLEPDGVILFDDSSSLHRFGSAVLAKEIVRKRIFRTVIKNPNYLFHGLR